MSIDNQVPVEDQTMRGRDYPALRQFTIFLENRVGQLQEVIRKFEGSKIRIVSLSVIDSSECAFVRFLLSHPEEGREIFERAGLAIVESNLVGVELSDERHSLFEVASTLFEGEVNIVQAYPLLIRPHGKAAVALMVDELEMAQDILARRGFRLLTEADLRQEEDF